MFEEVMEINMKIYRVMTYLVSLLYSTTPGRNKI